MKGHWITQFKELIVQDSYIGLHLERVHRYPYLLNYGFIHDHYDQTQYGEYVWKVFDMTQDKYLYFIVNEEHIILRII